MADLDISTSPNKRAPFIPPSKPAGKTKGMVKILIPKTKDATGDVPVNVNTTVYLIKRGVEVEVPASVVEALQNAKTLEYETVEDPRTGRKELVPQEAMSYPFQRL